ncbi:hypothetical protein ACI65C_005041 [Semiaphis heraclei]
MYLKTWKEFETASYNLLLKDPTRVRCTMKYCHSEATVQLKVTDDISRDVGGGFETLPSLRERWPLAHGRKSETLNSSTVLQSTPNCPANGVTLSKLPSSDCPTESTDIQSFVRRRALSANPRQSPQ